MNSSSVWSNHEDSKEQSPAFKIHIAIDYGTDGCAIAYCYKNNVTIYNKWNVKQRQPTIKAKTQILLNESDEVVAFGENAKIIYSSLTGKEKETWQFFDKFKMSLHGCDVNQADSRPIQSAPKRKFGTFSTAVAESKQFLERRESLFLQSLSGKEHQQPAVVFVSVFKHLRTIAVEHMNEIVDEEDANTIKDSEIQWILTVPAIWSEKAKSKMRNWMIEARLVDKDREDQCVIVYEPDCASLTMMEEMKQRKQELQPLSDEQKHSETIATCTDVVEHNSDDKKMTIPASVDLPKPHGREHEQTGQSSFPGAATMSATIDEQNSDDKKIPDAVELPKPHGCEHEQSTLQGAAPMSATIDEQNSDKKMSIPASVDLPKPLGREGDQTEQYTFQGAAAMSAPIDKTTPPAEATNASASTESKSSLLQIGDTYILIDAGGGTIDIACHKVMKNSCVEEIFYPSGHHFGGSEVDKQFIKLLKKKFTKEAVDQFREKKPNIYLELLDCFEFAKRKFKDKKDFYPVRLPFEFVQFLHSSSCVQFDEIKRIIADEKMVIGAAQWREMFGKSIDPTIDKIEELLKDEQLENCKCLILTGGFSCSRYFRKKFETTFGKSSKYKMAILTPKKPRFAVVEGAARMAMNRNYVQARRLRYTYGISLHRTKKVAKKYGVSDDYINNPKNICRYGSVMRCFKTIAIKNERVALNQVKTNLGLRSPMALTTIIPIMRSDKIDPKVAQDGEVLTVLEVKHHDSTKEIITEFHFYGTVFKVFSYAKSNPNRKQEVSIKYS